jgi:hypothetical protein
MTAGRSTEGRGTRHPRAAEPEAGLPRAAEPEAGLPRAAEPEIETPVSGPPRPGV